MRGKVPSFIFVIFLTFSELFRQRRLRVDYLGAVRFRGVTGFMFLFLSSLAGRVHFASLPFFFAPNARPSVFAFFTRVLETRQFPVILPNLKNGRSARGLTTLCVASHE